MRSPAVILKWFAIAIVTLSREVVKAEQFSPELSWRSGELVLLIVVGRVGLQTAAGRLTGGDRLRQGSGQHRIRCPFNREILFVLIR